MLCVGAVPLALTQITVSRLNRPGAFSGTVLVLSGLFPSFRISVRSMDIFSTAVLCKAKSKAHPLDAQITAIAQNTLCRKYEFTLV